MRTGVAKCENPNWLRDIVNSTAEAEADRLRWIRSANAMGEFALSLDRAATWDIAKCESDVLSEIIRAFEFLGFGAQAKSLGQWAVSRGESTALRRRVDRLEGRGAVAGENLATSEPGNQGFGADYPARYLSTVAAYRDGRSNAPELAERLSEDFPCIPAAWLASGAANLKAGRLDGAEEAFREALSLAPYHPTAWEGVINIRCRRGNWSEARQEAADAFTARPWSRPLFLRHSALQWRAGRWFQTFQAVRTHARAQDEIERLVGKIVGVVGNVSPKGGQASVVEG